MTPRATDMPHGALATIVGRAGSANLALALIPILARVELLRFVELHTSDRPEHLRSAATAQDLLRLKLGSECYGYMCASLTVRYYEECSY